MENQKRKEEIGKVVKDLGVFKINSKPYSSSDYYYTHTSKLVDDSLFRLSLVKEDKLKEIIENAKNLDIYKTQDLEINELIRKVVKEEITEKQYQKGIKQVYNKIEKLRKNKFALSMMHILDIQTFLENELIENPHKFTITISYNPIEKEIKENE